MRSLLKHFVFAVAVLLIGGQPAVAREDAPPTPVEDWSLEKVQVIGAALYRQDAAAAVASDALTRHFRNRPPAGLIGWIVVDEGENQRVRFLSQENGQRRAAWDVLVTSGGAGPVEAAVDPVLPADQLARFEARMTAANQIGELRCAQRYNAVVLKDPDSDDWLVWLLASTTDPNSLILTGHYRFRISADGHSLLRRDQLSATCITSDRREAARDGQLNALVVSHIVSPLPVETHVFASLLYRLPIYVVTVGNDTIWAVEGAKVRRSHVQN